jgi:hypothetical protein
VISKKECACIKVDGVSLSSTDGVNPISGSINYKYGAINYNPGAMNPAPHYRTSAPRTISKTMILVK